MCIILQLYAIFHSAAVVSDQGIPATQARATMAEAFPRNYRADLTILARGALFVPTHEVRRTRGANSVAKVDRQPREHNSILKDVTVSRTSDKKSRSQDD